jgi:Tol biopolymer transport system component
MQIGIVAQKQAFTIEDLYKIKNVGAPVLSNAGDKIAFTVSETFLAEGKIRSYVYIMNTNGGDLKIVSDKFINASSPFWSSDDQLYFVSDRQVYQYSFDSSKAIQITDFYSGISNPIISKDSKYLAFTADLFPECGTDNDCNKKLDESTSNGPLQAYIADGLLFRHWTKYKDSKETYLLLYDLREKVYSIVAKSNVLSDQYMLGGEVKYVFSPDCREICYVSSPEKNIAQSTNTDLYIFPLGGAGAVDVTPKNLSFDGGPVYSPNGKYIAYKTQAISGFEADRFRVTILNRETMSSETLTEAFDYPVDDLSWSFDSKNIYFTASKRGYNPVFKVNIETKSVTQITDDKAVAGYLVNKDDQNVFLKFSSVDKPAEIYSYNINDKEYSQIT